MIRPEPVVSGCAAGAGLYVVLRGRARPGQSPAAARLLLPALAIGAGEEVLWRGLALAWLEPSLGPVGALAATTATFALTHLPAQGRRGVAVHCVTGLVFGLAFLAGGLTAAVAAHLLYNTLAVSSGAAVPASAALEAVGLVKRFGRVPALSGLDLTIEQGLTVALLGPNGAGKTTFVSIVLGLRRPDAGEITVLGRRPGSPDALRHVAATPQEMSFPPTLRVREIVDFVLAHHPGCGERDELLERFGLAELAGRQAGGISTGQRRRLAVAVAFASQPLLVVLDEPTAGLDVESRLAVWAAIRDYGADGGTVLLTTHQLDEAEHLADRIAILERGRVRAEGTARELTADGDRSLQDAYLLLTGGTP